MAAFQSSLLIVATIALRLVTALQVTPDSPCAAVCLDSDTLDKTDPNSSNTKPSDISCDDDQFISTDRGIKFQQCLTCLQDSHFVRGKENDQAWFLYNLRYSVNYCVFGFPNNTDVGSNPCLTSEACFPLEDPLKKGLLEPSRAETYGYCDASGESTLGPAYDRCLQCVHAGSKHFYLSNFLTALEAGCRQQPEPGIIIGLNETVFSSTAVQIVDPKAPKDDKPSAKLSTPIIVGIAVGASIAALAIAGCVYLRIRKRKNRASIIRRRRRASPLSFQCQTHLTPRDPNFQLGLEPIDEKPYLDPAAALSSNPVSGPSPWMSRMAVDDDKNGPASKYPNITVTTCLPTPPAVHSSPQRASPDDYMSPQSATSTRSNAPLLPHKPYVPSEYTNSPPQQSVSSFSPILTSPSTQRGSPFLIQSDICWEDQKVTGPGRNLTGKHSHWGAGGNVEAKVFPTSFPPPPKR